MIRRLLLALHLVKDRRQFDRQGTWVTPKHLRDKV